MEKFKTQSNVKKTFSEMKLNVTDENTVQEILKINNELKNKLEHIENKINKFNSK